LSCLPLLLLPAFPFPLLEEGFSVEAMVFLRAAQLLPTGALAFDFADGGVGFGFVVEGVGVNLEEEASAVGGGMAGMLERRAKE
jgi:hypothetical protein